MNIHLRTSVLFQDCVKYAPLFHSFILNLPVRLVGDVLVATSFLSYAGPFNQEYRNKMTSSWRSLLTNKQIPFTPSLDITNWLVDNATVRLQFGFYL